MGECKVNIISSNINHAQTFYFYPIKREYLKKRWLSILHNPTTSTAMIVFRFWGPKVFDELLSAWVEQISANLLKKVKTTN